MVVVVLGQCYAESDTSKIALFSDLSRMLAELDVKCLVYFTSRGLVSFDSNIPVIVVESSDKGYGTSK